LFTGDFEGWTKGIYFPPLGDSMTWASARAPLLGNLEEDLFTGDFEGWTKGFCFPPLGDSLMRASGRAPLLVKPGRGLVYWGL